MNRVDLNGFDGSDFFFLLFSSICPLNNIKCTHWMQTLAKQNTVPLNGCSRCTNFSVIQIKCRKKNQPIKEISDFDYIKWTEKKQMEIAKKKEKNEAKYKLLKHILGSAATHSILLHSLRRLLLLPHLLCPSRCINSTLDFYFSAFIHFAFRCSILFM